MQKCFVGFVVQLRNAFSVFSLSVVPECWLGASGIPVMSVEKIVTIMVRVKKGYVKIPLV